MFFKRLWNSYTAKKKVSRILKEPELEFSYQFFQNDIPRIEFIRQKSLANFKDIEISKPTDFAVKIFTFGDDKVIEKIEAWKHSEKSMKLRDDEKSDLYYCIFMKSGLNEIKLVSQDILTNIFDMTDGDEVDYGVKLFE